MDSGDDDQVEDLSVLKNLKFTNNIARTSNKVKL